MKNMFITIKCTDEYRDIFDNLSNTYEINLNYNNQTDSRAIEKISQRGSKLSVSYPVSTVEELKHLQQIEDQLAHFNRYNQNKIKYSKCHSSISYFDEMLLDGVTIALKNQERIIDSKANSINSLDIDIPNKYIKSFIIKRGRNITAYESLSKYLNDNTELAKQIGFDTSIPDQSTFNRNHTKISKKKTGLEEAITRSVHAAYRAGIATSSDIEEKYGLNTLNKINERKLQLGTKNKAILNWIDLIFNRLTDHISFGRSGSPTYCVTDIVGSLAMAALINGPSSTRRSISWYYDQNDVVSADQLYSLIKQDWLNKDRIGQMFWNANLEIIELADKIGFFNSEQSVAADTTWINWSGSGDNKELKLINNPEECESGRGWCFAALGLMSRQSRFALSIDHIDNKDETVGNFRNHLRDVSESAINIRRIHTDREFYSSSAIRMCRAIAKNNWCIRIKTREDGDPPAVVEETDPDPGQPIIIKDVPFSDVSPNPNVSVHRIPDSSNKDIDKMGFLTDCEFDNTKNDLYHSYNHRWSIETYFDQLKNALAPSTKSPNPEVRLFLLNIGTLFYNIHTLINRARSPQYGFRLDVTYYQILQAIVESVFSRDNATSIY